MGSSASIVTFYGGSICGASDVVCEQTVIALNIGGAVVPLVLSAYLIIHDQLGFGTLIATGVVTLFVRLVTRRVEGIGVVIRGLFPPIVAALMAYVVGGAAVTATA